MTVYNQGLAAEAARRGKLARVIESGNLDVIEHVPTWTNRYNRVHVAPRGNSVAGQYVSFELANLHALVGLSVEHDWLGGVVKVAFSQCVNLGVRGTSAGGGWGRFTFLGSRGHILGDLVDVRGADWVHSGAGGTPELSTGIEGNGLGLGRSLAVGLAPCWLGPRGGTREGFPVCGAYPLASNQ